ncbi:hypothetical protein [Natrinema limicola]|nr:hypothetical protein [Natrinema limicola]
MAEDARNAAEQFGGRDEERWRQARTALEEYVAAVVAGRLLALART